MDDSTLAPEDRRFCCPQLLSPWRSTRLPWRSYSDIASGKYGQVDSMLIMEYATVV
jgi:hypothetical protein